LCNMKTEEIKLHLPYLPPFLFVDELHLVNENEVVGEYTFKNDEFFYQGHFKDNPITPGVILTETMAQIGVVSLGIYLLRDKITAGKAPKIALTSNAIDFFLPVFPGETVTVKSVKNYFRFNKLKCGVELFNSKEELVARGNISGMMIADE